MMLILIAAVPVLVATVSSAITPRVMWHLSPSAAAVGLTILALTISLATGLLLCLGGTVAIAELCPDVRPADWTVAVLQHDLPLSPIAGVAAGGTGAVLLGLAMLHAGRVVVTARRISLDVRALPNVGGLTIVTDDGAQAFAVPGRPSRVVVSTGLLRSLTGSERRAVIAHEFAHLRHRHHVYSQLARLAAAANPLVRPLARGVDVSLERWADEDAAAAVGDHATVARAVGAVALATTRSPANALGAAEVAVVQRVRYLLEPPVRRRFLLLAVLAAVAVSWAACGFVVLHVHDAVELAESASRAGR